MVERVRLLKDARQATASSDSPDVNSLPIKFIKCCQLSPHLSYAPGKPHYIDIDRCWGNRISGCFQHSRFQKIEIGPTEHLPFYHFQAINLTLYLAITPRILHRRLYSRLIFTQPLDEPCQLADSTLLDFTEPILQLLSISVFDHAPKFQYQFIDGLDYLALLQQLPDERLLFFLQLLFILHQPPPHRARGRRRNCGNCLVPTKFYS